MRDRVLRLWPEIEWIKDPTVREQVTRTWELALERSLLTNTGRPQPHSVHAAGSKLCHDIRGAQALCGVHARKAAESMTEFMGNALPIDHDTRGDPGRRRQAAGIRER